MVGFVFPQNFNFTGFKNLFGNNKIYSIVFANSVFHCDVDFRQITFLGELEANFYSTIFKGTGGADFSNSKFLSDANFKGAIFDKGEAVFRDVEFTGEGITTFEETTFGGEHGVDFISTKFHTKKGVNFRKAAFTKGPVRFLRASFKGEGDIDFSYAKFRNRDLTNFFMAEFDTEGRVFFRDRTFYPGTIVSMMNMEIRKAKAFVFDEVDLSRCCFLDTYIRHFDFRDVVWTNREYNSEKKKRLFARVRNYFNYLRLLHKDDLKSIIKELFKIKYFILKQRTMIFDEVVFLWDIHSINSYHLDMSSAKQIPIFTKILEEMKKYQNLSKERIYYKIHMLYSELQLKYEETGRYHESGDFFAGEMYLRQISNVEDPIIRFLLYFYKQISMFGERPLRAFSWFAGLYILFSLYYFAVIDIHELSSFFNPSGGAWDSLGYGLQISFNSITLGKVVTLTAGVEYLKNTYFLMPTTIETIVGAVFLSLFLLSMNRKFRRRKD
jgi:uncharacterized protein YjbI with pentapeptide repeats